MHANDSRLLLTDAAKQRMPVWWTHKSSISLFQNKTLNTATST